MIDVRGAPRASFGRWLLTAFAADAVAASALVGVGGVALEIAPRRLVLPWGMVFEAFFVSSVLIYWARLAIERPRACALRFAFAVFAGTANLLLAVALSLAWLGIASAPVLIEYGAAAIPLGLGLAAVFIYFMVVGRLKARSAGG